MEAHERVYVWEIPVRLSHWVNVFAILALSVTGYYIGNPILGGSTYLMAWMRGVHRILAYVFIASIALRTYWAFAGNQWATWRSLVPYLNKIGRKGVRETLGYYLFLNRTPPFDLGHNPLAGPAYSFVVLMMFVQIVTGFALQSLGGAGWRHVAFGWVFSLMSAQAVRLTHHMIMWLILGFAVHHVYSAILVDAEERTGILTSIFTGYKFTRRKA
jgi:Ni/Fe-hydrogenase 1 B-type cytochrome subunit